MSIILGLKLLFYFGVDSDGVRASGGDSFTEFIISLINTFAISNHFFKVNLIAVQNCLRLNCLRITINFSMYEIAFLSFFLRNHSSLWRERVIFQLVLWTIFYCKCVKKKNQHYSFPPPSKNIKWYIKVRKNSLNSSFLPSSKFSLKKLQKTIFYYYINDFILKSIFAIHN